MKFTNETMEVLKNFASIQPSIIFEPGNKLRTVHSDMTVLAEADISETLTKDCAIYDLPHFLRQFGVFQEAGPDLEWGDEAVLLTDKLIKMKFVYTDPAIAKRRIQSAKGQKIELENDKITLKLTEKQFTEIRHAMATTGLPHIAICSNQSKQFIQLLDMDNDTTNTWEMLIGKDTGTYQMVFRVDNWCFLPRDYDVRISVNDKGMGLAHFKADKLQYWTTTEATSSFTG